MNSLNIWPIFVSSITAFVIGSLWYSPVLFGKEWMSLIKLSETDISAMKTSGVIKRYAAQLVGTVITFCVLGFIAGEVGLVNATDGAYLGLILWLGFTVPHAFSGILWKKESFELFWIDTIYYLLVFLIGGAIIGGWR